MMIDTQDMTTIILVKISKNQMTHCCQYKIASLFQK